MCLKRKEEEVRKNMKEKWIGLEAFLSTLTEKEQEVVDTFIESDNEAICEVLIGYRSEEDQTIGYFKGRYPDIAQLYEFKIEDGINKGIYYLLITESYDEYTYQICKNKTFALKEIAELENSEFPNIDDLISTFKCHFIEDIRVEVKKEHNNGGHFHSYNIYYNDELILDGVFSLNEDIIAETKACIELIDDEINGYKINSIKKCKGNPSWNKSYVIEFEKKSITVEYEVNLDGYAHCIGMGQGQPKTIAQVINNLVDFDEVDSLYKEAQN